MRHSKMIRVTPAMWTKLKAIAVQIEKRHPEQGKCSLNEAMAYTIQYMLASDRGMMDAINAALPRSPPAPTA